MWFKRRDNDWGAEGCMELDCGKAFPLAVRLTLWAMLTHMGQMARYVRTGREPE